jgi:hypothetical protein
VSSQQASIWYRGGVQRAGPGGEHVRVVVTQIDLWAVDSTNVLAEDATLLRVLEREHANTQVRDDVKEKPQLRALADVSERRKCGTDSGVRTSTSVGWRLPASSPERLIKYVKVPSMFHAASPVAKMFLDSITAVRVSER